MLYDRREFLRLGGLSALAAGVRFRGDGISAAQPSGAAADYTLRIGNGLVELAPGHIISTTTYNGAFPGPLLRFREGTRAIVDVHNDTDTPEQLHWHGQAVPVDVDGAAEEGT